MLTIFDSLREISLASTLFRLLLSMLCGGVVGLERGSKRRAAGFRTYMLVCMGAALVMLTNQYVSEFSDGLTDPTRLGAQVISGIGFLGAGTIIVTRNNHVIGLTTAAGLWASACVGLAIGIGFYEGAIVAGLLIFCIITVMQQLEQVTTARSRVVEVYVELAEAGRLSSLLRYTRGEGMQLRHIDFVPSRYDHQNLTALMSLRLERRQEHCEVIEAIKELDCVEFAEEV